MICEGFRNESFQIVKLAKLMLDGMILKKRVIFLHLSSDNHRLNLFRVMGALLSRIL